MSQKKDYDYLFKIVIIGDSGVGKSCLLLRFADDSFTDTYISTIGVDFRFRSVNIDGKIVKLQIWDTAGQERFKTITSAYYRGANCVIVCYDISNRETFEHVEEWLAELNKVGNDDIVKMIVGNKADQEYEKKVTTEEGENLALKNGCEFIEVSAKTAINVDAAFLTVANKLMKANKGKKIGQNILTTPKPHNTISSCCGIN
jgi:Ras-related protein Rab-1A